MPPTPLSRPRPVDHDELGFTLIELLVVILIVGILAAIALPTFLGQQKKAQDASAKSDARNAAGQIEHCLITQVAAAASACGTKTGNPGLASLKLIGADSSASLGSDGAPGYTVVATSKSGNTYTIRKTAGAGAVYTSSVTDAAWTTT